MNADLSDRTDSPISRMVQAALDTLSDDIYDRVWKEMIDESWKWE